MTVSIKWDASSWWSFGPNSAWATILLTMKTKFIFATKPLNSCSQSWFSMDSRFPRIVKFEWKIYQVKKCRQKNFRIQSLKKSHFWSKFHFLNISKNRFWFLIQKFGFQIVPHTLNSHSTLTLNCSMASCLFSSVSFSSNLAFSFNLSGSSWIISSWSIPAEFSFSKILNFRFLKFFQKFLQKFL